LKNKISIYENIIITLFILSPGVAMHMGFDIGRYDHYNYFILILTIYTTIFVKRKIKYFVIPILLACGILIHEAYVFYGIPLILSITQVSHLLIRAYG